MPTKKKDGGGNSARDPMSQKVSRFQRKALENGHVTEKKVTEMITSSARKQKKTGTHTKDIQEHGSTTNLTAGYRVTENDLSKPCLDHAAGNGVNMEMESKVREGGNAHCLSETIFSPTFHISRGEGEMTNGVDFITFFQREEGKCPSSANENSQLGIHMSNVVQDESLNVTCTDLGSELSSEVSAIYLSMKNSKLECMDEQGQDHMSTEVCVEDEYEEFDDFDPYFFIKNLPDLSSVVPTFRPMLLPKQTRRCPPTTLVLDLDETLVHSTLEPCYDADFTFPVNFNLQQHTVYVRCRPHLQNFMERVASLFEIIIFTASQSIYAEQLLNVLDPKRRIIRHRVFRDSCVFVEGNYLKDLSVLGRDLAHVIIIDNSPQAFGFQVDNGIPIESWFDDRADQELLSLLPFLESLVGVEDVRPLIAQKFKLRQKIAAAVCPLISAGGDPYKR